MERDRLTIYLDRDVLKAYKRICFDNDMKMTTQTEILIIQLVNKHIADKDKK